MPRVAIVIVTYNSAECIEACLTSATGFTDVEVVVVDNASEDATRDLAARFENIRTITNSVNVGFAGAVNQGVKATDAPLILLLNPDISQVRSIDALAGEFENPMTGAAGGLLTDTDGTPQRGFMCRRLPTPAALILEVLGINRLWPHNPVNWHYRCFDNDPVIAAFVEQPAGAFLMFSRAAWLSVGGFDERFYPVWFEDVDFCARLLEAGYSVRYNPVASAKHDGAHSIRRLSLGKRERYWYGSLLEYAARHYDSLTYRVVCGAVIPGAMFRMIRNIPRSGLQSFAVYGAVCHLALRRLFRPRRGSGSSSQMLA